MEDAAEDTSSKQLSRTASQSLSAHGEPESNETLRPDFEGPVAAIRFYMDQKGLTQRDLVPMIGSRSKVSEVLSGSRTITMPMARALHRHLGIPAEELLKEPVVKAADVETPIDWRRFPLNQMAKRGWIERKGNLRDHAEELVTGLMDRAGLSETPTALYRKNDHKRANAMTNPYALNAWCWQVLAQAKERGVGVEYRLQDNPSDLLNAVVKLSPSSDGPRRAVDFLTERGITVEIVPHLPGTHLDGAAMRAADGCPVIGMTLRYDRIDNFWWVLLHELVHATRHLSGNNHAFIDDLKLAGTTQEELEADDIATGTLIPNDIWTQSEVSEESSPMAVMALAYQIGIHPAIVAGRARHERGNYRLLSQFVGTGEVKRLFSD